MKSNWFLVASIIQLVIGLLAIIAFIILIINGEVTGKWIITLILSVAFVVMGIIDIINYKK